MYCNVTNVTCNLKWIDSCSQFTGWYDAPLGFGRTDFTATVETFVDTTGEFSASGQDKQGDFTLQGTITGAEVRFVKDFTASDGYKDIKYEGRVSGEEVRGTYKFQYTALFVNIPIHENFYMKVTS